MKGTLRDIDRHRRRTAPLVLALLLVVGLVPAGLVAPAAAQQGDADRAALRVIDGVSDGGPLDVYVDGGIALAGIAFPSVSDPLALAAGSHQIAVTASGASVDAAILNAKLPDLAAGTSSLLALVGTAEGVSAVLYPVNRTPLAAGQARLRLIHGSPDAGPLDPVAVGAETIFPRIDYLQDTSYVAVPAGALDLELRTAGTDAVALDVPSADLRAGVAYDLFAIGQAADGTLTSQIVETPLEQGTATPAPAASPTAPTAAGRPSGGAAAIRAGTCAEPVGSVVTELSSPAAPLGAAVGSQDGSLVASGFTTVPVSFDALVGANHVLVVGGGRDVACGLIAGRLTDDGSLAVTLRRADGGQVAGVAVFSVNVLDPDQTDVSVFLAPGEAGAATPAAGQ